MNPLATPFTFTSINNIISADPVLDRAKRKLTADKLQQAEPMPHHSVNASQDTRVEAYTDVEPCSQITSLALGRVSSCCSQVDDDSTNVIAQERRQVQIDAEELAALRLANATLTQRLREAEQETSEEREVRTLKQKNAEIENLKATVERVTTRTEAIKEQLAERQSYLRDLNAQVTKLQPPLPFAIKEKKRKGKRRQM